MLARVAVASLLAIHLLALSGCQKKNTGVGAGTGATPSEAAGAAAPQQTDDQGRKTPLIKQGVTELAGNWTLVLTAQRRDVYMWLLKFSKAEDGSYTAEFLDRSRDQSNPELGKPTFTDNQLRLPIKNQLGAAELRGRLENGAIIGTFEFTASDEVSPMRLLPTDATTLENTAESANPPGIEVFVSVLTDKNLKPEETGRALWAAARQAQASPLAIDAFTSVLGEVRRWDMKPAEVQKLISDFHSSAAMWGPRMTARAHLVVATQLTQNRLMPQAVVEELDALAKDDYSEVPSVKQRMDILRDNARIELALADLRRGDEAAQKAAYEHLITEGVKQQTYNAELLYNIARYAAANDLDDKAIEYFSLVVALPNLEQYALSPDLPYGRETGDPTPSEALREVWKKVHGDDSGLAAHIESVYEQRLSLLIDEAEAAYPPQTKAEPRRTILIEFMTGADCMPCTAADIALAGLERLYPNERLITIRHHQHIPTPDPLANSDGEERYGYYEGQGVPWLAMDGYVVEGVGGFLQHVNANYQRLRSFVDQRAATPPSVELKAEGYVSNGELHVSASATGYPEDDTSTVRMRVAVVEREVKFQGGNGVKTHHNVVRELLGGAKGAAVRQQQLKYELTMPVADLRQHLTDYIDQFEAGRGHKFPNRPLDLESLALVVWVQNDRNREVLASTYVPLGSEPASNKPVEDAPAPPSSEKESDPSAPSPASAAEPDNAE